MLSEVDLKLLIIHNRYQSHNIGGEDVVYQNELLSLQKKLGEENVFFYEVSNDDIKKKELIFSIWFSLKHYKQVKQILEQHQIDLVHVHNFFPLLTPSVFKAAKDAGAKVVHTLHNYRLWCISGNFYRDNFGICENCLYKKLLFSGILYKCYRKSIVESVIAQLAFWFYQSINIYKNIDYFFVLTPFQKEKVKQLGVKKQRILLKPNSLEISLNLDENFTKDGYIYVGRIEESKGIYNLLKIWKTLDENSLSL